MKLFVIILLVRVFSVMALYESEWRNFKIRYGRKHRDADDELYRFNIFKTNLKEIENQNELYKKGLVTYTMKPNRYTDITADEFYKLYRLSKGVPIVYTDTLQVQSTADYAQSGNETEFLDWREKGAVTSVKDQGLCGSCYVFSSIGVLEAFYFKKYGKLVSLSVQHLLDCISSHGCKGGWPANVLSYVSKNGVSTEDDYPYRGTEGQCRNNFINKVNFTFKTVLLVNHTEQILKDVLDRIGPVSVCLHMNSKWMFYDTGVWYERECSEVINHAVLLVGYGTENGQEYWLIKNSLGIDWGNGGYIKFARNRHRNYCGITSAVSYVV